MSAYTQSSWTPAATSAGRKTTATTLNKDVCATCHKRLPKIDENLLKHSLRMKSEIAQLNTQKKSLMHMLARNEDFTYPMSPQENIRSCTSHSLPATTKLIEEDRYNSVLNRYAEVMRNKNLHDCEKLHTNSRKHEYKRWDYSHRDFANYHLKPMTNQVDLWVEEDEEASENNDNDDDPIRETEQKPMIDDFHLGATTSRTTKTGGRATRRELESKDGEEDIPEDKRVHMTIEKIRDQGNGGVLAEIHQIKERHKQLEALTETKKRAMAESVKPKKSRKKLKDTKDEKDALRKFLLANANLQKDLEFNAFKEKTTVKLNRNFNNSTANAKDPGVVWAPKWDVNRNHIPGKISKSTHPVSDAKKRHPKAMFTPAKPGDLPPCVFLPKHIEAKTPMESALLLEKFMKETYQAENVLKGV